MDTIHRFLFADLDIRGALVQLGPAWCELAARRNYPPTVRNILGELMAVTALIGSHLKQPGRITLQLQGNGPLKLLVMDCNDQLQLRGMAKCAEAVADAPLAELLGDAHLQLTHQPQGSTQHYQSHVPLVGKGIAEIFEHYLAQSEQTPTRLWLFADGERTSGLFLQPLPSAEERDPDGWNRLQLLAGTLRPGELHTPPEALLQRLFPGETVRLFAPRKAVFHCPRDEAKVLNMLRTLGREEVAEMLEKNERILIQDDICNHEYSFGPEVLKHLFATPSRSIH
jgi:molecular chaperone Hsp33